MAKARGLLRGEEEDAEQNGDVENLHQGAIRRFSLLFLYLLSLIIAGLVGWHLCNLPPLSAVEDRCVNMKDGAYLSLLEEVPVHHPGFHPGDVDNHTAGNIINQFTDVAWPGQPYFDNHALWAWGDEDAASLFVYVPGSQGSCLQFAKTMRAVAKLGYFVLCPQISWSFTIVEGVEKPVIAVQWALARRGGNFTQIVLGGHAMGAIMALSAGYVLHRRGLDVDAYMLQHPVVVVPLNVPGCQHSHERYTGSQNYFYCKEYFPDNMMEHIHGKQLVTCGVFCSVTRAQNSNWFSTFACRGGNNCLDGSYSTPLDQPFQEPVECPVDSHHSGMCPDLEWLDNPGDCMVGTDCDFVFGHLLDPKTGPRPDGGGIMFSHCAEHNAGVLGTNGYEEEGKTVVVPFMKYLITGSPVGLVDIWSQDKIRTTCRMQVSPYSEGLTLVNWSEPLMVAELPHWEKLLKWINATATVRIMTAGPAKWAMEP